MKRFKHKKVAAVVLVGAMVLGTAGVAFAYFTSTGNGNGTASVGSPGSWTVTHGTTTGGPLYPGSGSETVPFTITNAGSGNQAYSTLHATVVDDGGGTIGNIEESGVPLVGCLSAWFTATAAASVPVAGSSLAGTVPGPAGTATDNVAVTMLNPATSQNICQNATPDINLAVS